MTAATPIYEWLGIAAGIVLWQILFHDVTSALGCIYRDWLGNGCDKLSMNRNHEARFQSRNRHQQIAKS